MWFWSVSSPSLFTVHSSSSSSLVLSYSYIHTSTEQNRTHELPSSQSFFFYILIIKKKEKLTVGLEVYKRHETTRHGLHMNWSLDEVEFRVLVCFSILARIVGVYLSLSVRLVGLYE